MRKNTAKFGFTLVEIMIVVAIIGLLCTIAVPNLLRARTVTQANACVNNLRQIDAAKQQWALEQNQVATALPSELDIQPYLGRGYHGVLPYCPIDIGRAFSTSYSVEPVFMAPQCQRGVANGITNHFLPAY